MTGTERLEEAKQYFSHLAYQRLFRQAKKKYESLGRIGGQIRLSSLSEDEKEALSGLLVRGLYHQKSVTVTLTDLNEKLLATRFSIDLLTLLTALFAEEIKPKSVKKQEEEVLWDSFIAFLQSYAQHSIILDWLAYARTGKDASYRMLRERFEELKPDLQKHQWQTNPLSSSCVEIVQVVKGLNDLPILSENRLRTGTPLPIFAATLTGDAHFFDRDRFSGRLFYYGILFINRSQTEHQEEIENSIFSRKQYQSVGLALDDLSSQVLILGVTCNSGEQQEYSYAITLRMLKKIIPRWRMKAGDIEQKSKNENNWLQAVLSTKKVFISENPSICSMILDQLSDAPIGKMIPPIICTSGQPSHAALELLDFFGDQGVHMYYSGDLDVKGLTIAYMLHERYRDYWHPWGMTRQAVAWWRKNRGIYRDEGKQNKRYGLSFSNDEIRALKNMKLAWDEQLIEMLLANEQGSRYPIKIFQEMLISLLWEEFESHSSL
ncbi:hypothetical protein DCC39_00650 [Pueribacillus theae]|uniref:TIGR02679 family protein n=1 Tax=Pueribacillus theae TaxID=2171751 RepID=A0A2U1K827_9BACI|nr:TIGR02679 domain-containing protein [Pueribacillus theae]PWA13434.1 hypothetical protein DCC39_00650 [Pueribacillus theae]